MNLAKIENEADVQKLMQMIQSKFKRPGVFEVVGLGQKMEDVRQELEFIRGVTKKKLEEGQLRKRERRTDANMKAITCKY